MKISELVALLEQRREEYGDLDVKYYGCGIYVPIECLELVDEQHPELGIKVY